MAVEVGCPSENTLLDVIVEQRVRELAPHLDTCESCRELVAALARAADPPAPPELVGRFTIERVLGAGAMGIVYLAWDPRLDRRVALKVMHPESPVRAVDEARAMARLAHDNLVVIYEVEIVGEHIAIAMEYQPGGTLRDWLATRHGWREVVRVMRDVARGLAAIHDAGLVHRDLKPDNVLFDARARPRITDFGLATLDGTSPARAGTPAYMAPEQHDGGASASSDQWSFFVCLYEALAGQRPDTPPPAVAGVPRTLQALIARGLAHDPAARHPSMHEVARALDALLARRRRRLGLALAGTLLIVPATIAWAVSSSRAQAPCTGASELAARAWNVASAQRLTAVYRDAGMSGTGALVTRSLDGYASAWVAMHEDSCRATHVRGDQSPAQLDQRTQCLHERLAAVESVAGSLARADRAGLARGVEAVSALPTLDDCTAARIGRRPRVEHPRGIAARVELARARALRPLGRTADAIALAEPLAALGDELGDRALVAEAKLVIADALAADHQLARARLVFTEAELAGEAAGDDDLRARTLLAHASLAGALQYEPVAAAQLLARARAVVLRLGDRPDLERRVLVAQAAVAAAGGDLRGGEQLLRGVIASAPATGPEAWYRIVALRDLANMLGEQGRAADALPFAREAVAVAEAALGPDHAELSETLSVLALTLHYVELDDEARTLAARALAIKERARGPEHVSLSSTLMVQALIARDSRTPTGHAEARRATDRAIALRRKSYAADSPLLLALVSERGSLAVDAGEHAIARASFDEAIAPLVRAWGDASPAVVQARHSQARMAEREGDPARCAALAALAPGAFEIDVLRARCLVAAAAHREAGALIEALRRRELVEAERGALDLVAARLALATGRRDQARTLADRVARDPDVDRLELAHVRALLGDPRAAALVEQALRSAGEDLAAADDYLRGGETALVAKQPEVAARHAAQALAIAQGASGGPDLLARCRCLAARARGQRCD